MAFPGTGYRTVNSLAIEISRHLIQPYVSTTITSAIVTPGSQTVNVGSTSAMYNGAFIVVDSGLSEEVIQITAVNSTAGTITANFSLPHAANVSISAATFPIQSATDPLFTQTEILSYIARAQNEFLAKVPCIYQLNIQTVEYGQVLQQLACDSIEMHRVAYSQTGVELSTLVRANDTVTATTLNGQLHGLSVNQKFAIIFSDDPSFDGSFSVLSVPSPTTFTYTQVLPNATATDGFVGLWSRIYEMSQEELSMQNPNFRANFVTSLSAYFEDRTGLYRFGVSGKPAANFPIEVLVSIRDTDTLQLTDSFLVPDVQLHGVKYKALEYIWSKDGVAANPQLAVYCKMRFDRLVLASWRWMLGNRIMKEQLFATQRPRG